ncbi:MAG: hypothetical protein KF855_10495 [Acidobacteria bacterium]|nr:hypothetical protein [Acidobacteriota bacterium]
MAAANIHQIKVTRGTRGGMLVPALILWAVVLIAFFVFVWVSTDISELYPNFYILPWVLLTGAIILSPSIYLWYKGRFDLFHPLVFAAWIYLFPAFVIGGIIVAFGWVEWYFLSFIEDPRYTLPLTLVYISVGFIGLTLGYFLPVGRWGADLVSPRLPVSWNWRPEQLWIGGLILLALGIGINILGFLQGVLGFQRNIDIGIFDGLLYYLVIFFTMGTIVLWISIFSVEKKTGTFYIVLAILLLFIPLRTAFMGSRAGLLIGLLPIVFGYYCSGRKLDLKTGTVFAVLGVISVIIGIAYGTSFRNLKGGEGSADAASYTEKVGATVDQLIDMDTSILAAETAQSLANRLENLTSVAVVVSNYEKLAPYEASYGLENNIINDLYTSFIPRFIWADKPPTSDARSYSDLYFSYGENSFAISPFGDLLRNFGVIGIPLGMLVLGFYLRLIYSLLIETQSPAIWKKTAYYLLLGVVSYESFYALIFPSIIRTLFVLIIGLMILRFFSSSTVNTSFPKGIASR